MCVHPYVLVMSLNDCTGLFLLGFGWGYFVVVLIGFPPVDCLSGFWYEKFLDHTV